MQGNDAGRRILLRAWVAAGLAPLLAGRLAQAMSQLPAGRSIYRLQGMVHINGSPAHAATPVTVGDVIETGADGQVVFVIGSDVFMVKANSRYELTGSNGLVQLCRLVTGAVLQVFGPGAKRLETSQATIGIRGTGVYLEARATESYICTCYGTVDLAARADPAVRETVTTMHHDAPRWLRHDAAGRPRIEPAPMLNHSDDELILLESLVNRSPPFVLLGSESYR